MHYDFIVLHAGDELSRLESFASELYHLGGKGPEVFVPSLLQVLSSMALDLDNRRGKLLFFIAKMQESLQEHMRKDLLTALLKVVGDLAMNLFNSVDELLRCDWRLEDSA